MAIPTPRFLLRFGLTLLLCTLPVVYAHAAAGMNLKVGLKNDVLTCSALLPAPPKGLKQALSDGSDISVEWKLSVAIEHKYWLNTTVASVVVNRHAVADLVSRSWLLEDRTSGITRRVFSLDEAIRFLTSLPDFPVVDRSLLNSGQTYLVSVSISEWEGERPSNPWTSWLSWFGPNTGSVATEFKVP